MNIDKFRDSIKACRFCFMCRHLSGVGNVSFREADTPRIRAAMLYGAMLDNSKLACSDFIDTIYSSDLSAACRFHCVNNFDENGMVLAARRDIVEAGLAPADVMEMAEAAKASDARPKISGSGDILYYIDTNTAPMESESKAFGKIMKKAGIKYRIAKGGDTGKVLETLGFAGDSSIKAAEFAEAVNKSGAKVLVTPSPAVYDSLANDLSSHGIKLIPKVMHVSEFLAQIKIKFAKKAGKVYYLESDFLKNYNSNLKFPRELLGRLGAEIAEFGTNSEESYTCGEGAVVFDKLRPGIVEKMAKYVEARADNPASDKIVVASPYTKIQLSKHSKLKVCTLAELAAACL